jgi:hypothetical protein
VVSTTADRRSVRGETAAAALPCTAAPKITRTRRADGRSPTPWLRELSETGDQLGGPEILLHRPRRIAARAGEISFTSSESSLRALRARGERFDPAARPGAGFVQRRSS